MYVLHIANKNYSSWSLRAWLLLRGLSIPFEERLHPFDPDGSSFAAFREFSPSGMVPCLEDGPVKVWDSLAIAEYLAEAHEGVWPAGRDARAWARSVSAEMHSGFTALRSICSMSVGVRVRLARIAPALQKDLDRIAEIWTEGLARFGGPYLAGARFTAVDAMYAPVAYRIRTYGLALPGPAMGWAERMLAHPAMAEWERAAIEEPYREPGHDAEIAAQGVLIEDRRVPPARAGG